MNSRPEQDDGGALTRIGMALSDWAERWFPDALVFAMLAIVVVFVAGLSVGSTASDLVTDFGDGFWELVPFTMQMAMIVIGGYVVASSPPVARIMRWLASIPRTPRGAVAFVALCFHDQLFAELGVQPHIQCATCPAGCSTCTWSGLPCRGGGRLSRRGQRMGARAFLFCRPVDGLERIDPSGALQDQWANSIDPNYLHLAERAYSSHCHYSFCRGGLPFGSCCIRC